MWFWMHLLHCIKIILIMFWGIHWWVKTVNLCLNSEVLGYFEGEFGSYWLAEKIFFFFYFFFTDDTVFILIKLHLTNVYICFGFSIFAFCHHSCRKDNLKNEMSGHCFSWICNIATVNFVLHLEAFQKLKKFFFFFH